MRRLTVTLVAAITCAALLPAAAAAANASLPDIEDEVMCTICGTTLQLSDSPQAERERVFINELIAKGKTKDEIKAAPEFDKEKHLGDPHYRDQLGGHYGSGH